jgi:hypothetical protein
MFLKILKREVEVLTSPPAPHLSKERGEGY